MIAIALVISQAVRFEKIHVCVHIHPFTAEAPFTPITDYREWATHGAPLVARFTTKVNMFFKPTSKQRYVAICQYVTHMSQ